ncbi:hypothetical protein F5Y18DRAFT_178258 [Xylariaceae sp. FL1019]|nr:hypothetical protein F5Y18DRAFT_178258 [Xylariaceae sp. FL1019]
MRSPALLATSVALAATTYGNPVPDPVAAALAPRATVACRVGVGPVTSGFCTDFESGTLRCSRTCTYIVRYPILSYICFLSIAISSVSEDGVACGADDLRMRYRRIASAIWRISTLIVPLGLRAMRILLRGLLGVLRLGFSRWFLGLRG